MLFKNLLTTFLYISLTICIYYFEVIQKSDLKITKNTAEEKITNKIQKEIYSNCSIQGKYDYSVVGINDDGEKIVGEINLEGSSGEGKIINSYSENIEIVVESFGKGNVLATDIYGNEYLLKIK